MLTRFLFHSCSSALVMFSRVAGKEWMIMGLLEAIQLTKPTDHHFDDGDGERADDGDDNHDVKQSS